MNDIFTASYEKGILRPFRPLDLKEGQVVRLMVLPQSLAEEFTPLPVEKVSIERDTTEPEARDLAAWDAASKKALERLEQIQPQEPEPKAYRGKKK
jgi:predicted DNA-binding antitoxin AbrB/MazE fold protein